MNLGWTRSNLGTFWLKIEQFWPFEEISIFSNGGHLGHRTALMDTILRGTVRGFCLKFFFQPIYTDYANLAYFDKRSHLNLLL
jgi:hypothetical protein